MKGGKHQPGAIVTAGQAMGVVCESDTIIGEVLPVSGSFAINTSEPAFCGQIIKPELPIVDVPPPAATLRAVGFIRTARADVETLRNQYDPASAAYTQCSTVIVDLCRAVAELLN